MAEADANGLESSGPHYSPVMVRNGLAYCAGCLGVLPDSGALAGPDVASQTRQALENLEEVLKSIGSGLDRLLMVTCYLERTSDFEAFDRAYAEKLGETKPARATVAVSLVMEGALVEIAGVASV